MDDLPQRDRWDIIRVVNEELLETARFPVITYRCPASAVTTRPAGPGRYDVTLNGTLTLHGVTRNQPIVAHVVAGDETLRSYGELPLKRSDYGLKDVAAAGNMIKVKDEVKVAFDIVARRQ